MSERGKIVLTSLEEAVKQALDSLGVAYVTQFPTRSGFLLDFALIGSRIAIEADGPLHANRRSKDRFRDYLLRREGWRIVRIDFTEVDKAKEIIEEAIRCKK